MYVQCTYLNSLEGQLPRSRVPNLEPPIKSKMDEILGDSQRTTEVFISLVHRDMQMLYFWLN